MKVTYLKTLTLGFIILLCLTVMVGQAAGQKPPEVQTAPAAQASAVIPVAEVATLATEVSDLLRTLYTQFAPSREIEKIQKELPDVSSSVAVELKRTEKGLQAQPTLEMLQTEESQWQKIRLEMLRWQNLLAHRATQLQLALGQLADLQKTWRQTLDAAQAAQAPETIVQQITAVLPAIDAAQIDLQTRRSALLDLQGRVAKELDQCGTALAKIAQAQQMVVGGFASRERLPIWSAER